MKGMVDFGQEGRITIGSWRIKGSIEAPRVEGSFKGKVDVANLP